ncbi:hypothetical protein ACTXT7_017608 [Hymenolepis weldensis]
MCGRPRYITIPTVIRAHKVSTNSGGFRCCCFAEGHIKTPPSLPQGLRVNADADAYVETLQIIPMEHPTPPYSTPHFTPISPPFHPHFTPISPPLSSN